MRAFYSVFFSRANMYRDISKMHLGRSVIRTFKQIETNRTEMTYTEFHQNPPEDSKKYT
jgi:hypothetical protein